MTFLDPAALLGDTLWRWLPTRRWYASKSRRITGLQIADSAVPADRPRLLLTLIQAFAREEPSDEAISLLTATIDEDVEWLFQRLPANAAVAPIAGRGEDVRALRANRS
jgi:hypothetical protein